MRYLIPAEPVEFSEEIKKSRFITYLQHTPNLEVAKQFWQEIRHQYPDARHHCWAAVAGSPVDTQQLGFSDDGEPSGTAGKPMLNSLLGSNFGEISAVVVRYFGGVLLGTGGLTRAYGNGVQQALKLLKTVEKIERNIFILFCQYDQMNLIQQLCKQYDVLIEQQYFTDKIELHLAIPLEGYQVFATQLLERSAGQLALIAKQDGMDR